MDEALGKYSKIRLIIYSLIIIWCIYLSAGFTRDLMIPLFPGSGELIIDGTDMTPLADLATSGLSGLASLAEGVFYAFIIAVASLVPILLLRLIGVRKDTRISKKEFYISLIIFLSGICLSVVIGFIITKLSAIIPPVFFSAIWALINLIYILSIRSKIRIS